MAAATYSNFYSKASADTGPAPVLNKRFTRSPEDSLAGHKRAEILWTVAKVSAVSLFLIGAIGGAIALSILNPPALIFFAIGFSIGLTLLASINTYFDDKIAYHEQETEKYERIKAIFEKITAGDEYDLKYEFSKHDISTWNIENLDKVEGGLKTLAIGLAHFIYTKENTKTLSDAKKKTKNSIEEETDPDKKRLVAQKTFILEQSAAISRLYGAYDLHLVLNPFSQQKLSDIGTIANRDIDEVLLDRHYVKADEMFFFKNASKAPITYDDLCDDSLDSLEARFI